jgi:chorismate mutase/prephenate dehydratase
MKQAVAFLGPSGTYSEIAAKQLFAAGVLYVPCETLDVAVKAVLRGAATAAVLPVENSTEGSVHRTLDLLTAEPLAIRQEWLLPVHHQLLSKAKSVLDITDVWAHPQALAQCRAWLTSKLPIAKLHAANSNGEAAQLAADDPSAAAIASAEAAELYSLRILASNIEDSKHNTTRFIVVTQASSAGLTINAAKPTSHDKTSLVCSLPNKAGSLYGLLGIFAKHKVNLTKLESRPLPNTDWDYLFYIDCDGHMGSANIKRALQEVETYAVFYKMLGSYPIAKQPLDGKVK